MPVKVLTDQGADWRGEEFPRYCCCTWFSLWHSGRDPSILWNAGVLNEEVEVARRAVGWIVPLIGFGLAFHALADSTGTAHPDSAAAMPDSVSAQRVSRGNAALGKKIFTVKCVACHRPDGSGGIKVTVTPTPDWRNAKRMADPRFGDGYLRDCITNGKPKSGMVAWSRQGVKPADIENLIAYIRTFSAPKAK